MSADQIAKTLGGPRHEGDDYRCRCPLAKKHNRGDAAEPDFERKMLLARLRWNLERLALRVEARLRRESTTVTADALALAMATEVARAKPRSLIVPWHLDDEIVDAAIERVAREIVEELYPRAE